jgi:hypothetical protein
MAMRSKAIFLALLDRVAGAREAREEQTDRHRVIAADQLSLKRLKVDLDGGIRTQVRSFSLAPFYSHGHFMRNEWRCVCEERFFVSLFEQPFELFVGQRGDLVQDRPAMNSRKHRFVFLQAMLVNMV